VGCFTLLCLGIGLGNGSVSNHSLPVPSHYSLFINSPLFTLSTYYDIFPFSKKFLITIDYFSKYVEVFKVSNITAETVIRVLNSYFYIKCVKRVFFVHEKVFYAETKVEAV
jgi:hypothetical protein